VFRSHLLKSEALWKPILLVAALGSWGVVLTGVAVEDRFLADAYPLVALFVLLGLPRLIRKANGAGRLVTVSVVTLVIVGVSWQLLANIGLAWRYPGA
jgi:pyridoxal biosynthesis lyase PdxS